MPLFILLQKSTCCLGIKLTIMKRHFTIALLLFLLQLIAPQAFTKVLRDFAFTSGTLPDELKFIRFGDLSTEGGFVTAERNGAAVHPYMLYAPTAKSWGYLICDVPAHEVPSGGKMRVTAFVQSNLPGRTSVCICEGITVGGFCQKFTKRSGEGEAYRRSTITAELPRREAADFISIAVGYDYYSTGAWAIVDRIVVEHLADGEASILKDAPTPLTALSIPSERLHKCFSFDVELMRETLRREVVRYRQAGLDAAPTVQARLKLAEQLDALLRGELELEQLPVIERGLLDTAFRWRLLPEMAVFGKRSVFEPENATAWSPKTCANGHAGAILLISNDFYEQMTYQIRLDADGAAANAITLRQLHWMDGVPDIPVDYTMDSLLELGSGEQTGFMLEASARKLPPGSYEGTLVLSPVDKRLPERRLPWSFRVLDYRLPDTLPVRTFVWDFNMAAYDDRMAWLHEMRINTFVVTLHSPNDFKLLHDMIDTIDRHGLHDTSELHVEVWFVREAHEWRPEFDAWLDRLEKELASRNWPMDRWHLHIYDETLSDEFYRVAKAIKATHPEVKIFSDTVAPNFEDIAKFAPVIDYWCPHLRQRTEQREQYLPQLKAMRATHPVWVYDCDSTATYPLERYRVMPYISWLDGDQGISFWSSLEMKFRPKPGENNWGMCYFANGRHTPSRRLRMFAAGLEDYLLLAKAAEIAPDETRALAERVFAAFNRPELPEVIEAVRAALLSRIEQGK